MTELEKIEYAKSFIDKLANGINPLDDTPISEDDIANNVRLSRCFFYVSSILQKEIERERRKVPKEKKPEKLPFSLTPEQLQGFEYSPYPISVYAMGKKINWLVKEEIEEKRMEKFSYRKIYYWLCDIGMIEWCEWGGGKPKRFPTQDGEAIGLVLQIWENYGRKSPVIYLSEEAQHFIIDHIEAVMAAEKGVYDEEHENAEPKKEVGDLPKPYQTGIPSFSITEEQLRDFGYAPNPISVTALTRKINWLVREDIAQKKIESLSYRKIIQWLLNLGMIEYREWEDGKIKRFPTEEGERIGLVLADWDNYGRRTPVIYYTEAAQRFVIDHIDAVIATEVQSGKTSYPWGVNDEKTGGSAEF